MGTDVIDYIALFLAAAALLLTSFSAVALSAWRRAHTRALRSLSDSLRRLAAAVELVGQALDGLADQTHVASLFEDLGRAWDLEDALQRAAAAAVGATRAHGALVAVTGPDGEQHVGSSGDVQAAETTGGLPLEGLQAMTFATLRRADPAARSTAYGAAVPITGGSTQSLGLLTAFFDSNEAATEGLPALERVAAAAAPALEAALSAESNARNGGPPEDLVTGLPTRAAFLEGIARETARARRDGMPLSVVLLDVDGFRSLGERAEPVATDRLLVAVAETIDGVKPPDGLLYRVGGDAFGLLLPGQTSGDASGLLSALRVAQRERETGIASLHLWTGIAELQSTDDAVSLATRAQAALDATRPERPRSADEGG